MLSCYHVDPAPASDNSYAKRNEQKIIFVMLYTSDVMNCQRTQHNIMSVVLLLYSKRFFSYKFWWCTGKARVYSSFIRRYKQSTFDFRRYFLLGDDAKVFSIIITFLVDTLILQTNLDKFDTRNRQYCLIYK